MPESSNPTLALPATTCRDVLTDILRAGAQQMLAQAIEAEVADWIDAHQQRRPTQPATARWSATATCPSGRSSPASAPVEVRTAARARSPAATSEARSLHLEDSCRRTCGRPRASRS